MTSPIPQAIIQKILQLTAIQHFNLIKNVNKLKSHYDINAINLQLY